MSAKDKHALWQGPVGEGHGAEVGGFGLSGDEWPNRFVALDISEPDGTAAVMVNMRVEHAEALGAALLEAAAAARRGAAGDPISAFRTAMRAARQAKTN